MIVASNLDLPRRLVCRHRNSGAREPRATLEQLRVERSAALDDEIRPVVLPQRRELVHIGQTAAALPIHAVYPALNLRGSSPASPLARPPSSRLDQGFRGDSKRTVQAADHRHRHRM
jgi:hypothetical protein